MLPVKACVPAAIVFGVPIHLAPIGPISTPPSSIAVFPDQARGIATRVCRLEVATASGSADGI
jgi:hypothetical protein